jgi:hypothetical protein
MCRNAAERLHFIALSHVPHGRRHRFIEASLGGDLARHCKRSEASYACLRSLHCIATTSIGDELSAYTRDKNSSCWRDDISL